MKLFKFCEDVIGDLPTSDKKSSSKMKMMQMARKSLQAKKLELKMNKTQKPTLPDSQSFYNLVSKEFFLFLKHEFFSNF